MTREEKNQSIVGLTEKLNENRVFYLADVSAMTVEQSNKLRRLAFNREVSLNVVKNTLLKKAMEQSEKELGGLYDVLKGNTSIMFAEVGNAPAKLIKEFRKKSEKPILKAAFIDEDIYIGDEQLAPLASLKSKNELIADVIMLLQSPAKNVISALQSGGAKLTGILKTLAEGGSEAVGSSTEVEKQQNATPEAEVEQSAETSEAKEEPKPDAEASQEQIEEKTIESPEASAEGEAESKDEAEENKDN
ncbi:MAG: 50S ribosomal protein L10 [Flavobacteriales bacterium]|nr:MAG: 50S ribosomal protein L10 [Flavobacteriales bacterium]